MIFLTINHIWERVDPRDLSDSLSSDMITIYEALMKDSSNNSVRAADDIRVRAEIYRLLNSEEMINPRFRKKIFGLLNQQEAQELAEQLGIDYVNREQFIRELIGVSWSDNQEAEIICSFFGIPSYILGISEEISNRFTNISIPWPNKIDFFDDLGLDIFKQGNYFKPLKHYQSDVSSQANLVLEYPFARTLICMPTGTGKTRTAMQLVCEYLNENPNRSVVWVADKRELIDQACSAFAETWEFVGKRPMPIGRWYSGTESYDLTQSMFLATTFGSLLGSRAEKIKQIPVGLIVVDEAHRAPTEKWGRALRDLIQPRYQTKIIGLTATPVRGSGDATELIKFFKGNFIKIPDRGMNLIKWLERQKFLAYANYESIELEIHIELTALQKRALRPIEADYPTQLLEELAKKVKFNQKIATKLLEVVKEHESVLFFSPSVEHSKMIVTWLRSRGISAAHIDGNTNPKVRRAAIESFRKKEIQVLSNYEVLDTGFDAPEVDCVFMARPTTSHVVYHQIIGRGLRGPALGGTEFCKIIDVPFNIETHAEKRQQMFSEYQRLWEVNE